MGFGRYDMTCCLYWMGSASVWDRLGKWPHSCVCCMSKSDITLANWLRLLKKTTFSATLTTAALSSISSPLRAKFAIVEIYCKFRKGQPFGSHVCLIPE